MVGLARVTGLLAALVMGAGGVVVWQGGPPSSRAPVTAETGSALTTTTTSLPITATTTTSTSTTTSPPPPTEAPPPPAAAPAAASTAAAPEPLPAVAASPALPASGRWSLEPYGGLGIWVDVYDWSATYGGSAVGLADIDRMASLGVQTLYIQTARADNPEPVLEKGTLTALIDRAHQRGMRVVGWFLPYLDNPTSDLQHLMAAAALGVDGLGVDIESRSVEDVNVRNQRLLDLSASLRAYMPGRVLSAIVLPPVVMEDINPNYWPGYPWAQLAAYYDVWQPMNYWTNRTGYYRSAYAYTAVDVDRIRQRTGNPNAVVHPIGGIGDKTTVEDINGMVRAAVERACIGGSLYDYRTTGDDLWPALQQFRSR